MDYPGNLFVVAAPSGAGKSSLVSSLLQVDSHLVVAVSHTTRAPRGQEQQDREYHFTDDATFRAMVERHEFVADDLTQRSTPTSLDPAVVPSSNPPSPTINPIDRKSNV